MGKLVTFRNKHARPDGEPHLFFIRLPDRASLKCSIVYLSRAGACFESAEPLPSHFIARAARQTIERFCEVMWRQGDMVGVRFVTSKTMKRRARALADQSSGNDRPDSGATFGARLRGRR